MAYRGRNYRWVRKYTVPQRVSVVRGGSGGYRGGGNGFRGYGGRNCDCQCHRELKQCCLSADAHANPSIPRCTQAPPKSATNLIAPPQERSPNYYVLVEANENAQVPTNFTSGTMGTPETCPLCQGSVYQLPGHNANPGVMYTIGQGHTLINPSLPASTILANLNQGISSGVFTHSNTIGSGHITGQSGSVILANPCNDCIPTSNSNNVGHSNPEGQLIFNQGNTNTPGNTLVYASPGNMGNCNTGSHNMCGNFNQGNSINTYVNPYGQGNTIAPRYITGTQSSMNSGHVSMPGHRSNKMVRTNPVSHVMPASMNQGNGSCRTNQGNQIGHENTAAHGQGSGTNTLVNANPGNNNNPSNLLDSKPCCSKAKNSQGIPAAKEQKKDSSNSSDEEKFIPLAQPKI